MQWISLDNRMDNQFCNTFTLITCSFSFFSFTVPLAHPQSLSWKWSVFARAASQRCYGKWLVQYLRAGVWQWSSKGPARAWIFSARARRRPSTGPAASEHCRREWKTWPRRRNLTNILFLFNCRTVFYIKQGHYSSKIIRVRTLKYQTIVPTVKQVFDKNIECWYS